MQPLTRRSLIAAGATAGAAAVSTPWWLRGLLGSGTAPEAIAAAVAETTAGTAATRGTSTTAVAASATDRVLVVVQLSGGNDGLNTLVPYGDGAYYDARPTLGIPEADVLALDGQVGLHPSLNGFAGLYEAGQLAVVEGIGYEQPDRSHFVSFDYWWTATPHEPTSTGWLGRWLDEAAPGREQPLAAVSVGSPGRALVGENSSFTTVFDVSNYEFLPPPTGTVDPWLAALAAPGGTELLDFASGMLATTRLSVDTVDAALGDVPLGDGGGLYGADDLSSRLQFVAELIAAGVGTKVFYVDTDGFDTHADQAETHAALLTSVDQAIGGFLADVGARGLGDRVVVLTVSEFGRRVAENGSDGTDHGAASMLFLAGAPVRGGVYGTPPSLTDLEDGDLRYTVDFRMAYATVLESWLGAPSDELLGGGFDLLPVL